MYQAYGRARGPRYPYQPPRGGGPPPYGRIPRPPPPPPPPAYERRDQQHGQQVNLGATPKFRDLSKNADLNEREDWLEHVFDKLAGNGSGIRWCFVIAGYGSALCSAPEQ